MKQSRESVAIIFTSIFLFAFLQPTNGSPTMKPPIEPNCTYSVQIETSCTASAGTTSVISLRFGDSGGNSVVVRRLKNPRLIYDPKGKTKQSSEYSGFQPCAVDMFDTHGPCLSKIVCSLYVKRLGSDEWRPGWAKVLKQGDDGRLKTISCLFYFRVFVPENVWFGYNYCSLKPALIPEVFTGAGGEP